MRVRFVKFGEGVQTIEVRDKGVTIRDVLRIVGEEPEHLDGFQARISGESGEAELDRPVREGEAVMLVPEVKGGW